jgi:hypothetical protein
MSNSRERAIAETRELVPDSDLGYVLIEGPCSGRMITNESRTAIASA